MIFSSRFAVSLFLISLLALGGCAKKTPIEDQIEIGRINFQGYGCMTCHKVGDEGGIIGPDLTFVGFRKTPEWLNLWLSNPEQWKHNTLMPNFYLKEPIRKSLVAYLSTLQGENYRKGAAPWDKPSLKDDPIKRGESIFNHAGCTGCHGVAGSGNYPNNNVVGGLIPSLIKVSDGYSKDELAEKIRKGVPQSAPADPAAPAPMIHMPTWSQKLTDDEIGALVEYLYSLNPHKEEESW